MKKARLISLMLLCGTTLAALGCGPEMNAIEGWDDDVRYENKEASTAANESNCRNKEFFKENKSKCYVYVGFEKEVTCIRKYIGKVTIKPKLESIRFEIDKFLNQKLTEHQKIDRVEWVQLNGDGKQIGDYKRMIDLSGVWANVLGNPIYGDAKSIRIQIVTRDENGKPSPTGMACAIKKEPPPSFFTSS